MALRTGASAGRPLGKVGPCWRRACAAALATVVGQALTFTPFQNATRPLISAAASLGSG
jgi:hypothetical protein